MKRFAHLLVLLVMVLLAVACTSASTTAAPDTTQQPTTTTSTVAEATTNAPESSDTASAGSQPSGELGATLQNIALGYQRSQGVWPGFDPLEHPVILHRRDAGDTITDLLVFNHPEPDELGDAAAIDAPAALGTVHHVTNVTDEVLAKLAPSNTFEFHIELGGVDSFAMVAGGSDAFFDTESPEYPATLMHEMFHRYQDGAFASDTVGQDVEGYDYSARNIELALLEERALIAALDADPSSDEFRTYAEQAAAIRRHRLELDARVALDEAQERIEGTARWLEHQLDIDGSAHHAGNPAEFLVGDAAGVSGTKDHFGFGRWYTSGAAFLTVAERLGVDDVAKRVESGASPAAVVLGALGTDVAAVELLVDEARSALDADGELAEGAAALADRVADEPPVFGDDDGAEFAEGDGGEGEVITDEQWQCMVDAGLDLDSDSIEIPDAIAEECLT